MQTPLIDDLISALRVLPGVGAKSAQRMAYYLLERDRKGALRLSGALQEAMDKVGHCEQCRTFSETDFCPICASSKRNQNEICVVESPSDIAVIEQSGIFRGTYFVLMGKLSPIDGIGPDEIGLPLLELRLQQQDCSELIIATNPSVEGEATAHYLQQMAKNYQIKVSRLAQGIPLGGELEYLDSGTLTQAFISRREV
ncbi:recombination protein RecR [Thiosulfatimonas sediminis]|uniref:Recombination protein RecR n=1 Tax=Thiosulfatimonas sediminis TaxID=2675054 RepID=A0A6F8PWW8_9GAMM|nr:recombination mediator RecR [Thiosulfatimonas sediminis]BBP46643.1 recombination protein RecR [Thiosulfatimonas sediminis]